MDIYILIHIYSYIDAYACTEPEIAVGHWPISDQFQDLAEQK